MSRGNLRTNWVQAVGTVLTIAGLVLVMVKLLVLGEVVVLAGNLALLRTAWQRRDALSVVLFTAFTLIALATIVIWSLL